MAKKNQATAAKQSLTHHGGHAEPEANSGIPLEMPLGACRPKPLQEILAMYVQAELQRQSEDELETWEEANDFDEEDPNTLDLSQYELVDVVPEAVDPGLDPEIEPEVKPEDIRSAKQESAEPTEAAEPAS